MYKLPLLRAFARSGGTCLHTSPSSPRYMSDQMTRFWAMFNSHVTPTHWSRNIVNASADNAEAFLHSPSDVAIMASARMDNAIACGFPTLLASALDCSRSLALD